MLMRTRHAGTALCWHLLALSIVAPAVGVDDKSLSIGDGDFIGGFVTNEGRIVVAVRPSPDLELVRTTLVSWNGAQAQAQEIDFVVKTVRELAGRRFLVRGYKRFDGGSEAQTARWPWPFVFGYRVYLATGSGLKLEEEFDLKPEWVEPGSARVAPDLRLWVGMADLFPSGMQGPGPRVGRRFAIGGVKSGKIRRTVDVEFFPTSPLEHDVTAFRILSSDGPLVLASYGTDLFLFRFTDDGVETRPVDHLREVVYRNGSDLNVVWQADEDVLWALVGGEWLAFDLRNVAYTFSIPEEPFLRHRASTGRPHPIRGFVEVQKDGARRFRIRHSRQSPQFPDWREENVSNWREGTVPWRPLVSSNGRHFLHVESGRSEDGAFTTTAQRVDLAPAPPPQPPETKSQGGEGASVRPPKPAGD